MVPPLLTGQFHNSHAFRDGQCESAGSSFADANNWTPAGAPGATSWLLIDSGAGGTARVPVRISVAKQTEVQLIKVGDPWRYSRGLVAPPRTWNRRHP